MTAAPYSACGNACVDPLSDVTHCGTCANACAAGQACQSGSCVAVCAGGATCSANGRCVATCPSGEQVCDAVGANATARCVDVQTDARHCGACNKACAPGEACTAGACKKTCASARPTPSCDGSLADGGLDCASCGAGFAACGNLCVDLTTSPNHCGGCNTVCGAGQACNAGTCGPICAGTEVCARGVCEASCPAGTAACNALGANATSTCTDLQGDPASCGACGKSCASGQGCRVGACVTTCGEPPTKGSPTDAGAANSGG